jgi:hypothetical protein
MLTRSDGAVTADVWMTAACIAFLTTRLAASRDEWSLVERKARRWLAKSLVAGGSLTVDGLVAAVAAVVCP